MTSKVILASVMLLALASPELLARQTASQPVYGCGHLCVYIISDVLGEAKNWADIQKAFEGCGGNGCGELSFRDIAEVTAARMGWHSRALKLDARQLAGLPCPAVAAIHPRALDAKPHFVVLAPLSSEAIQVLDPADPPRIVAPAELYQLPDRDFRGEVLLLDSQPIGMGVEERLLGGIRHRWSSVLACLVLLWGVILAINHVWRRRAARVVGPLTAVALGGTAALTYVATWAWLWIG